MSTVLVNPYRFGGATTIADITSAIHAYEPANIAGTSTITGWTDSVGSQNMTIEGVANSIDGDGGVVYPGTGNGNTNTMEGAAIPLATASTSSTVYVTMAYSLAAGLTDFYIFCYANTAGGAAVLVGVDASASNGYDTFWTDSRTLYANGNTRSTPTRNEVHDDVQAGNVLTVAFDRTTNWTAPFIPIGAVTASNDAVVYGIVMYTDSADRSTAEDWATGILP